MECFENCWLLPPTLPPPPPLPHFLSYLNLTIDCDLCPWAGVFKVTSADTAEPNVIHLSSLLIIVGVISAGCGAGIMAALLSFKRLRSQSSSVRHLSRKESTRNNRTIVPARGGFTVPSFTENTYCEAPYAPTTGVIGKELSNIYAELQEPSNDSLWTRRDRPTLENCYLELSDLPKVPARPPALATKCIRPWFLEESPGTSTYYGNYEATKCTAAVHYHQ